MNAVPAPRVKRPPRQPARPLVPTILNVRCVGARPGEPSWSAVPVVDYDRLQAAFERLQAKYDDQSVPKEPVRPTPPTIIRVTRPRLAESTWLAVPLSEHDQRIDILVNENAQLREIIARMKS